MNTKTMNMKKLIAITALAGLIAVGCASREKNRGGTFDTSTQGSGSQRWDGGKMDNDSNKSGLDTNKSNNNNLAPDTSTDNTNTTPSNPTPQ
jgi:hypothetical protein